MDSVEPRLDRAARAAAEQYLDLDAKECDGEEHSDDEECDGDDEGSTTEERSSDDESGSEPTQVTPVCT